VVRRVCYDGARCSGSINCGVVPKFRGINRVAAVAPHKTDLVVT